MKYEYTSLNTFNKGAHKWGFTKQFFKCNPYNTLFLYYSFGYYVFIPDKYVSNINNITSTLENGNTYYGELGSFEDYYIDSYKSNNSRTILQSGI